MSRFQEYLEVAKNPKDLKQKITECPNCGEKLDFDELTDKDECPECKSKLIKKNMQYH